MRYIQYTSGGMEVYASNSFSTKYWNKNTTDFKMLLPRNKKEDSRAYASINTVMQHCFLGMRMYVYINSLAVIEL